MLPEVHGSPLPVGAMRLVDSTARSRARRPAAASRARSSARLSRSKPASTRPALTPASDRLNHGAEAARGANCQQQSDPSDDRFGGGHKLVLLTVGGERKGRCERHREEVDGADQRFERAAGRSRRWLAPWRSGPAAPTGGRRMRSSRPAASSRGRRPRNVAKATAAAGGVRMVDAIVSINRPRNRG
jgi:hypothetical protein